MLSSKKNWMLYILPSSITAEGLHIVLPLYVISLGGTVSDVGIVIALQYGASALGSIFWGKIIDRFHVKRVILLVCFSAITLCCIWLYFTIDLGILYVISTIIGFFIVGKNPITQLLVMETVPNNQWSKLFSLTAIITTFGSFTAFVVGSISNYYFEVSPYFLFCAITSGIAVVASIIVKSSTFLERQTLTQSIHGLNSVFRHFRFHFQMVFPKSLQKEDFKHLISIFKGNISHEIGILFLTNFFFYLGSNIYFTALIPFLKNYQFSDSQVFLVYLIQTITLLVIFYLIPRLTSKIGEERTTTISFIPRTVPILATVFLIPITIGFDSFVVAAVSSSVMVMAFSLFSTSNSILLFKTIPRGFEGRYLGVNSFMIGIGIFIAALMAGFITNISGYLTTFLIAVGILVVSFILFQIYLKHRLSHRII
ncbi:MAG TPA: MFS transporter [Nitrosopumilaceae archaeon]|nr:MFS transporter [Nitrosopumilaceae archaeon]